MEAFGMYLLKSAVWLTGFALMFIAFLRNERFFSINRAFLLTGIVASVVLPFFTWHYTVVLPSQPPAEIFIPEFADQEVIAATAPAAVSVPGIPFYWWLYIIGTTCLLLRLIWQTGKVFIKLFKTGYEKNGRVKLVRTSEYPSSFSFFSFVFVNPSTPDIETMEIVNHETGHIQNRHWFDLLLIELLRIFQWFNPFVWIYGHLVRQNHEYLADETAMRRTANPALYQAALLNQVLGVPVISLANSFSYSLNSKRFNMMKKKIDSPFRKLKTLMVLPLIALVLYAFAEPRYVAPPKEGIVKGQVTTADGTPLKGATVVISGKTIGTITDDEGNFALKDVSEESELVISYVGYNNVSIKPDFDKNMQVKMEARIIEIEKIVIGADSNEKPAVKSDFSAIEQLPQFPGGNLQLAKFLSENTKYPEQAKRDKTEGTVIVSFVISREGKVKNVTVSKGVTPVLNEEALRVVNSMPDWKPGVQNDKAVDVNYSVPIEFSLKNKTEINIATEPNVLIRLHDGTQFTAENQPLLILDGIETPYDQLNKAVKNDSVESISVLRDASATKTFGDKGKNGVILITSKKNAGLKINGNVISVDGNALNKNLVQGYGSSNDVKVVGYGNQKIPSVIFRDCDENPQYPGGDQEMRRFIMMNLKYPVIAQEQDISGTAVAEFVIKRNGKVDDVKVTNDIHQYLKDEVIRALKNMPDWTPGKKNGQAIDVSTKITIEFKLYNEFVAVDDPFSSLKNKSGSGDIKLPNAITATALGPQKVRDEDLDKVFLNVPQPPQFPGGTSEMVNFIRTNLKYPSEAFTNKIQGTVIVGFVIDKNGKPVNAKVIKEVHPLLDAEALRVISKMPDWTPGQYGDKKVKVAYTLPVVFKINQDKELSEQDEKTYTVVEQQPQFPGGSDALKKFISENIKYPAAARKMGVQGVVIIRFVIKKTGEIANPKILRSVGPEIDKEALRIIGLLPRWNPGLQGGKPVDVFYTIPVPFKLQEQGKTDAKNSEAIKSPSVPFQFLPRRVVFEGGKKSIELKLVNNSNDTVRYSLALINYQMNDNGTFKELSNPGPDQKTADKYINFSSKSVLIRPNAESSIMISLTGTEGLSTGEYRSHIYFRSVLIDEKTDEKTMKLRPLFGYSIPVIIRIGELSTKVSLSDIKLEFAQDTVSKFAFTFNRSGNKSVYGDLQVNHISAQGKSTSVGAVKGIALYTPNLIRTCDFMKLDNKAGINYHSGKLQLVYSSQDSNEKYAEAELSLR